MYRLSLIISEIYNKYLPLAEKDGIILNLDFADTTREIADPERVKADLDQTLASILKNTDRGEISLTVNRHEIVVTDTGTLLSRPLCELLSNRYIAVDSRVGFGTTVRIILSKADTAEDNEKSKQTPNANSEITSRTESAVARKTPASPKQQSTKKPSSAKAASLSSSKRLTQAAQKADKKIQKITRKAQKRLAKTQKTSKAKTR